MLRSYWSNRRPRRSLGCTITVLYCIVLYCTVRVGVRGTLISRSTRIWRDFYLAVRCFVSPDKSVHSSHVSRDSETKYVWSGHRGETGGAGVGRKEKYVLGCQWEMEWTPGECDTLSGEGRHTPVWGGETVGIL